MDLTDLVLQGFFFFNFIALTLIFSCDHTASPDFYLLDLSLRMNAQNSLRIVLVMLKTVI